MKRFWSAICIAGVAGVAACERTEQPTSTSADLQAPARTAPPIAETGSVTAPIAEGAPAYVTLYPGGVVETDPVTAASEGSAGGLVTYLTEADPEAVIAFHRRQAEAAGLASVMAMNQGDARAYGAAKDQSNLQVVAAPTSQGRTSVQLSWSSSG